MHGGLHPEQLLLANEECEEPDLQAIEVIVDVAQPLVLVLIVALRFIAEEDHGAAAVACAGLLDLVDQTHAFGRVAAAVGLRISHSLEQVGEERPLRVARLVLGLRVVRGDLGMRLGQQQAQVLDGACLADPRRAVGQRARDAEPQAAGNEIGKALNGRCADAVVAGLDRVKRQGHRTGVRIGRQRRRREVAALGRHEEPPRNGRTLAPFGEDDAPGESDRADVTAGDGQALGLNVNAQRRRLGGRRCRIRLRRVHG